MALTDKGNSDLLAWKSASGAQGREFINIYSLVNRLPNADEVVARALREGWKSADMTAFLSKMAPQQVTHHDMGQNQVADRTQAMNATRTRFFNTNQVPEEGDHSEPSYQPQQGPMTRADQKRAQRAQQNAPKTNGGFLSRFGLGNKNPPASPQSGVMRPNFHPGAPAAKKGPSTILIILLVLLVLVLAGGAVTIISNSMGFTGFGGEQSIFGTDPVEIAPEAPDTNPLNFQSSIKSQGFLGQAQKLVFIIGLGILGALIGDIVYRKQWWDGITAVEGVLFTCLVLFPVGTARWIGVVFLYRELRHIWFASFQGGRDFTPMATYFLLVAVFGGLMLTKIGAVQNVFPTMIVSAVPPMVQLGYYFQVMQFAQLAFPAVVYLSVILGTLLSIYECIRPSEDKSSRFGSLIAAGLGLIIYFVFIHFVGIAAWIAFLIAILVAAGGSAALRSEPAKQYVTPIWGVRSPFDGGMLLCAVLLLLVVIFGQVWWLVPLL